MRLIANIEYYEHHCICLCMNTGKVKTLLFPMTHKLELIHNYFNILQPDPYFHTENLQNGLGKLVGEVQAHLD